MSGDEQGATARAATRLRQYEAGTTMGFPTAFMRFPLGTDNIGLGERPFRDANHNSL